MAVLPRSVLFARAFVPAVLVFATACGSGGSNHGTPAVGDAAGPDVTVGDGATEDATVDATTDANLMLGDGGGSSDATTDVPQVFNVTPAALQTIMVTAGQNTPTVLYNASYGAKPIAAGWSVDRGDVGSIGVGPSIQGTFQPTGTTGGLVNVIAGLNGQTLMRQVFVQISAQQNGANPTAPGESQQIAGSVASLGQGGGVGGVGGEGLGGVVTDPATLSALTNPTNSGQLQGLTFLYPYDKTVFPRGLLAPLLQWAWSTGNADAIQIHLTTTSGSFSWTGTFAAPAVLQQTGGSFIRHPIPQDIWTMATNTAGNLAPNGTLDRLQVSLVVAKAGQGYGPITETWTIAPARLEGTVYYNSYGTNLVKNSTDLSFVHTQYGAAVLGIQEGATGPSVVAGTASPIPTGAGCRVCHVVSSDGSTLIAQHGDNYGETSVYDLKNGNAETVLTSYDNTFGWAGLSANGSLAWTNAGNLAANTSGTSLYSFPPASATPITVSGVPTSVQAGTPAFSPDGAHVAFDFLGGTIGNVSGNGTQLVSLAFDATTNTFSNLTVLATMTAGKRAGFPSFFPTNDAVAFHYQLVNSDHLLNTWHGAEAQIWWSDLATGTATPLSLLNGLMPAAASSDAGAGDGGEAGTVDSGNEDAGAVSYLPAGPNNHANDTVLNYEPTVNPVASGGYIWVIFTSRRLYGNVATTDPWQSDPRDYDATQLANTTTKKLWVAAIDLNAPPGTDPSHPAFYLPAQELLAGNARGFWALAPCKPDGQSCESGDQCCNGYCEAAGADAGADAGLVCTNTPPNAMCSQPEEKCATSADCCDSQDTCVNGFCTVPTPQ